MRKYFLLVLLVLISFTSKAQYGDAYHKPDAYRLEQMRQDRMNQNDAAHRANMNSNSNSGSGVKGNYGNGNNYSYEKTARERAEKAAAEQAKAEKEKRERLEKEQQQKADWQEYYQVYKYYRSLLSEDPLSPGEIHAALREALGEGDSKSDPHYSSSRQKIKDAVLNYANYVSLFSEKESTATYDELIYYALKSTFYPVSALKNFEKLQQRFPEKAEEVDQLILTQLIPVFFNGFHDEKEGVHFNTYIHLSFYKEDNLFLDKYLELEKKYPALTMKVNEIITTENTPFVRLAQRANSKSNPQEAQGYALKQLNVQCVSPFSKNAYARKPNYYLYLNFYGDDGGELRKFEAEDWMYYAKRQDISVFKLLKYLGFIENTVDECERYLGNCEKLSCDGCHRYKKSDGFKIKSSDFNYNAKEIITACAKLNEPSALNMYGLMIAAGIIKEDKIKCLEYFKKAAELGDYNGALNYKMAGAWNLKGYKLSDYEDAELVLANFKMDPTKKEEYYKEFNLMLWDMYMNHSYSIENYTKKWNK
ncbi:hypothetical protein HKT18_07170 [Flavobacterium sp. IMCC34852]|uniref:Sel1 repeat family protein n=1 Tax=Flavobacterium rivulicola TaxID=2732161 RepID=A0A7Y3R9T4_9FLAO|nr:hypothetical protein [Flavobacterium sp. IMCC34852]NNT71992.1 hypothetical protein [Flavobacterium sp. IMCC34852]